MMNGTMQMKAWMTMPGSRQIPLMSELALVVLMAWVVSGWLLPADGIEPVGVTRQARMPVVSLPDLKGLLAVPIFGKVAVAPKPANIAPVIAKPAPVVLQPLTMKLLGTVVAGEHSAAIIAMTSGSDQSVFFIGDSIQPGATLKSVEVDAIVVDRGSRDERISLEQTAKLASSPMPYAAPVQTPAPNPNRSMSPSISPPQVQSTLPVKTVQKRMSRATLQHQLQNFPALLSQARVVPHFVNGKPGGFMISEIAPNSLYQQAGLQNGDIILSVNGNRITGPQQAMSMYNSLKQANALDLDFMRAGQRRHTHYDIR